jgi:hypothetical protein
VHVVRVTGGTFDAGNPRVVEQYRLYARIRLKQFDELPGRGPIVLWRVHGDGQRLAVTSKGPDIDVDTTVVGPMSKWVSRGGMPGGDRATVSEADIADPDRQVGMSRLKLLAQPEQEAHGFQGAVLAIERGVAVVPVPGFLWQRTKTDEGELGGGHFGAPATGAAWVMLTHTRGSVGASERWKFGEGRTT